MYKIETIDGRFYTTDKYLEENGFIIFKDKYDKEIQLNKNLHVEKIREV